MIEQRLFVTCLKQNRQCKKKWGIHHFHNIPGLFYDPKQLLWSSTHKLYVLTLCCIFRFWCSFDKRWSIEWWISVGWQQPKVRRILRGGLSGGACNWQLARQLGRNFSTFSWQILVRLWLHTTQLADSCFLALSTSCPPTQGKVIDGVHRLEEMRYW